MGKQRLSKAAIRVNFDTVLEDHLPDLEFDFEDAMLAIAHAASGNGEEVDLRLGDDMISANQMVEVLKLKPFVDVVRDCNQRAKQEGGFSPGDIAIGEGRLYRILMRREVTQLAMPRTDNHEVLLETMSGEYSGFVAENELQNLSNTNADGLAKILAKMVHKQEIELRDALVCYINTHHLKKGVSLLVGLAQAAIAEANLDHVEAVVDLPQKPTVAQTVDALNLKPFLTVKRKKRKK